MRRRGRLGRRGWREGRGLGVMARLLTVAAVLLIALALLDMRVRPLVEDMVSHQAGLYAFRVLNDAMLEELDRDEVAYGELARVTRGEDGRVVSIQTDVVAVNRLKARMADSAARELEDLREASIRVPVGTLLGNEFFSGRGPEVEIRILPMGVVGSELYNRFESAGINQTLHQVMLQNTAEILAVLPGYRVRTQVTNSFCLAETVIVGEIPDGYTIVDGDGRSDLSRMHDYRVD